MDCRCVRLSLMQKLPGMFHFGKFTVRQAKEFMRARGINMRPAEELAS